VPVAGQSETEVLTATSMPAPKALKRMRGVGLLDTLSDSSEGGAAGIRRLTSEWGRTSATGVRPCVRLALVLGRRFPGGEEDRPRHPAHGHLDEHGSVQSQGLIDEPTDLDGLARPYPVHTVRVGELHEVGIRERRAMLAAPVLVEIAGHVA